MKLNPAWTLEETWDKAKRAWGASDTLGMTPEEAMLGSVLSKLALNVCLMATAYGVRCLGPANPSHFERLKRHVKAAHKRGKEAVEKAEMEVRTMPVRYAFAQEVTLYQKEPATGQHWNGEGGWTVSPHWRRGHWRWQLCGVGRVERRRVAIPSVLVNGHLFVGSPADTVATYRVQGG